MLAVSNHQCNVMWTVGSRLTSGYIQKAVRMCCSQLLYTCSGDVERDFWLAFDLLQDPKDHAEFTIVRQWVQAALLVSTYSATR